MSTLSVGDVVQLKSGGPKMTVQFVGTAANGVGDGNAKCQWFASELSEVQACTFPELSLKKA